MYTARFLSERDARMYARTYVRDGSGLCIISHLLFVSRFQSLWLLSHTGCVRVALRSFSLRKGVTVAWGEEANSQRENCVTPLYSSTLSPKKFCPRFFLQATWEFIGALGDYGRLIAEKRQDSPTLSFVLTSWMQANTLLLTLCIRWAIVVVRLLNPTEFKRIFKY